MLRSALKSLRRLSGRPSGYRSSAVAAFTEIGNDGGGGFWSPKNRQVPKRGLRDALRSRLPSAERRGPHTTAWVRLLPVGETAEDFQIERSRRVRHSARRQNSEVLGGEAVKVDHAVNVRLKVLNTLRISEEFL